MEKFSQARRAGLLGEKYHCQDKPILGQRARVGTVRTPQFFHMNERRVVVTGIGVISPVGNDLQTFWNSLIEGRSGISRFEAFDSTNFDCKIAGEIRGFEPAKHFKNPKTAKRTDRFTQFAMAGTKMAIEDSGIDLDKVDRTRFGVMIGSGIGGLYSMEEEAHRLADRGPSRVSPFTIAMMISNMASGMVSMEYDLRGPNMCIVTACATANNSIGEAWRIIKFGDADAFIAGGAEATITPLGIAGFASMKALSCRNHDGSDARRRGGSARDDDRDAPRQGDPGPNRLHQRSRHLNRPW